MAPDSTTGTSPTQDGGPSPGPMATWVLSNRLARTWICNNDLLRLAVSCS